MPDLQWRAVEKYVSQLIDEYVPEEHREGFLFHAKDLFHGSGLIFDRRKYPLERSREALKELLSIPRKFREALTNYNPKCLDTGGDMPAGYALLVWT